MGENRHKHAGAHTRTRARTHTNTHARTQTHTHTRAHTNTHTRARTQTHTRARTQTHTRTRAHTNTHTHARAHTNTHARAHKHTRARTQNVNSFIRWATRRCTGKVGIVHELEVAQVIVCCGRRVAGAALCRSTSLLSARGWLNKAHGNETTLSS